MPKVLYDIKTHVQLGDLEGVQQLVSDYRKDPRQPDSDGRTALHHACACNEQTIAMWLVEDPQCKCELHREDHQGTTALHLACGSKGGVKKSNVGLIKWLVEKQGNKGHIANRDGWSPLHFAASVGNLELARWLITEAQADVGRRENLHGRTAAHVASVAGHTEVVAFLLQASRLPQDLSDSDGESVLHLAASQGRSKTVQLLLQKWAKCGAAMSPDIKGGLGRTALHQASIHGFAEVAGQLLVAKARVDLRESGGNTALHFAAGNGDECMVKLLLEHRAQYNMENNRRRTPIHWAKDQERHQVVRYFEALEVARIKREQDEELERKEREKIRKAE